MYLHLTEKCKSGRAFTSGPHLISFFQTLAVFHIITHSSASQTLSFLRITLSKTPRVWVKTLSLTFRFLGHPSHSVSGGWRAPDTSLLKAIQEDSNEKSESHFKKPCSIVNHVWVFFWRRGRSRRLYSLKVHSGENSIIQILIYE